MCSASLWSQYGFQQFLKLNTHHLSCPARKGKYFAQNCPSPHPSKKCPVIHSNWPVLVGEGNELIGLALVMCPNPGAVYG